MAKKTYYNVVDNVVENIVIFDGEPPWEPRGGIYVDGTDKERVEIGYIYDPETELFSESVSNNIYLHTNLSGGDGIDPIGITNDGIESISILATFRTGEDSESDVITSINSSWRVTIRNKNNDIYDIVNVTFTNGVVSFNYTTTSSPDICSIVESDFEDVTIGETTYEIKLIGNTTFKVYRSL